MRDAYYDDGAVRLYHGDVLDVLREIPNESVNTCVSSPPYWGLRDYGTAEWSGDCAHTYNHGVQGVTGDRANRTFTAQAFYKDVCRKCGAVRVDKQIGIEATPQLFVAKMVEVFEEVRRVLRPDGTLWLNLGDSYCAHLGQRKETDAAGPKQRTYEGAQGAPSRTATGLKPKDLVGIPWRVAFALQEAGWWLRSDIIWAKPAPMPESVTDRPTRSHEYLFLLAKSERYFYDIDAIREPSVSTDPRVSRDSRSISTGAMRNSDAEKNGTTRGLVNQPCCHPAGRNKRDVWTVNSEPFAEAHFATFPPALILPCILAGSPPGGTVLDPFNGAGTTALVAKQNGRKAIGCDLSADYLEMSARRLSQGVLDF